MTEIRTVREEEIAPALFRHFIRHQVVTKCWRKEKGDWVIRDIPFIDDWNKEAYEELVSCLKHTVRTGGFLCGAFQNGQLKGLCLCRKRLSGWPLQVYGLIQHPCFGRCAWAGDRQQTFLCRKTVGKGTGRGGAVYFCSFIGGKSGILQAYGLRGSPAVSGGACGKGTL